MSIGDWEPLWLGPPSRRLYAALHPAGATAPDTPAPGVLLVPPLLHESPRSRRFIAEVASALAALGLPCLRFDFFGTGDSAGRGDEVDFASMAADLDVATAALRARTGVARVALLAWRVAALPLQEWVRNGGRADLTVLWEPVADGASWLQELVRSDARERTLRPPLRPGVPRSADPTDGQLMGFPVSMRLRRDFARARLEDDMSAGAAPTWVLQRAGVADPPAKIARRLDLPATAPVFDGSAAMDSTVFLTPPVRDVVGELGLAMRAGAWR